ncbi:MAG: site-specific integrase [Proteobacteria bacterium]|nr:site-specific integrase [Pseudomonadota bacterium]
MQQPQDTATSPQTPVARLALTPGSVLPAAHDDAWAVSVYFADLALAPLTTARSYKGEVSRFMTWLNHVGYPPGNVLASLGVFRHSNPVAAMGRVVAARREPRKPRERVEIEGEEDLEHLLSLEDIHFVLVSIEGMPRESPRDEKHYQRCRWLFRLAYLSWLRISEISRLQMGDFEFKEGGWRLYIWPSKRATKAAVIDVFPQTMDALADYRRSLGKVAYPFTGDGDPAVMAISKRKITEKIETPLRYLDGSPTGIIRVEELPSTTKQMTERALYAVLKQVFLNASRVATGEQAARLGEASPHWLRHSGITHALNKGMDPRYVARQARHKGILTTLGVYDGGLTPEMRRAQMALL